MEYIEVTAKTLSDAITEACQKLSVTSDRLDYQVIDEGSNGFLGLGSKPAVIKAAIKESSDENVEMEEVAKAPTKAEKKNYKQEEKPVEKVKKEIVFDGTLEAKAQNFLKEVFEAMGMNVSVDIKFDADERTMDIDLSGDEMGLLIGKRGQTLDSLQYLVSLVVNKDSDDYVRIKVDTENYRTRRKETLENLAKNIAYKVKRTKRPVSLEPMNPYERRIIHSALQNDKYVTTHSEGDEPFRRVVVTLKR